MQHCRFALALGPLGVSAAPDPAAAAAAPASGGAADPAARGAAAGGCGGGGIEVRVKAQAAALFHRITEASEELGDALKRRKVGL
jgi:hypothetical protein